METKTAKGARAAVRNSPGLENNALTSVEVCNIIKTGAELGLAKLKFGDLEIEFSQPTKPQDTALQPPPDNNYTPPAPDAAMSEDQRKIFEAELLQAKARDLELDEIAYREEQVAQMLLEDPVKAEQLIQDGELEEDVDATGDDDF